MRLDLTSEAVVASEAAKKDPYDISNMHMDK